ncbi:MAG: transposase domain-containing protein [Mesorhizobium sp.]|nr:MAG: transposase domain-containing protein [Mesorhizobium sp.]RWD97294.1 MAG: transposase domain-containing protein [Mesorhizobium sp.]
MTCKLNGIVPANYLADLIGRVSDQPTDRIDELLPGTGASDRPPEWQLDHGCDHRGLDFRLPLKCAARTPICRGGLCRHGTGGRLPPLYGPIDNQQIPPLQITAFGLECLDRLHRGTGPFAAVVKNDAGNSSRS